MYGVQGFIFGIFQAIMIPTHDITFHTLANICRLDALMGQYEMQTCFGESN